MMNTINISDIANVLFDGFDVEKLVINNDVAWELSIIPKVCLVPFDSSGTPIYYANTGTATAETTVYVFNKDLCDFEKTTVAIDESLVGTFIKGAAASDVPAFYLVCTIEGTNANMFGLSEVTIPAEFNGLPVKGIAPYAFQNDTTIQTIHIQNGVLGIGDNAFDGCTALNTIEIPESVVSIYSSAFNNTGYYADTNNWKDGLLLSGNTILSSDPTITIANIGENIDRIAFGSFADRPLTTINYNAVSLKPPITGTLMTTQYRSLLASGGSYRYFYGLSSNGYFRKNAGEVSGPEAVPEYSATLNVGSGVRQAPPVWWVSGIQYQHGSGGKGVKGGIVNITPDFLVNTNITELAPHCIISPRYGYANYELTTTKDNPLIIPSRITKIAPRACAGYYNIQYYRVDCDVLSEMMFANLAPSNADNDSSNSTLMSNIKDVVLNGKPTEIPKKCFYWCNSLLSMTIPASVVRIGEDAFYYCDSMASLTLSVGLKTIDKRAFANCTALTELTIPNTVAEIGENAFEGNNTITKIVFNQPSGMEVKLPTPGSDTGAFYYKSARAISIYTDNETIKNYAWATDNVTATIYHLDGTAWV